MSNEDPKVISFGKELDPDREAEYAKKVLEAKKKSGLAGLKGTTPVGHVERPAMPLLQKQVDTSQSPSGLSPDGGVVPRPVGSPVLSPQTAQQLEEMQKAQGQQIAEDAKKEEEKKEEPDVFDVFDFYGRSEAERILNNKKRRQDIESRCAPMNFEDLIMKDEVRQVVPIHKDGRYNVEFRSLLPTESLFIKKFIARESEKSEQYLTEKYSFCQLACSVLSIAGKSLGVTHLKDDGEVDEELFLNKLKALVRKSGYIIADIGINYTWFDLRVRRLLNPDDLGNG